MKLQANQLLKSIRDNRYVQVLFLPVGIYNILHSIYYTKKQSEILKEVINENDDFFKTLVTMGITKDRYFYGYTAKYQYDGELFTDTQMILDVAQEKILEVITKYVRDDNLLGIIKVGVDIVDDEVVMHIKPTHWNVFKYDLWNLVKGLVIWGVVTSTALHFIF